jgi:chemosensory pili system protein ChpA (sensor histidine kinase/response regulator)
LLQALRAALEAAIKAPPDEVADGPAAGQTDSDEGGEISVSPRTVTANALSALSAQARDLFWEADDVEGEAVCAVLSEVCFYLVDPVLRSRMLELAGECVGALELAHSSGRRAAGTAQALRSLYDEARPSEDDAAAIARALGMTEEEAASFGLTGHLTAVGLDDDDVAESAHQIAADEDAAPAVQESLEDLFRRDAQELVTTGIPRALQRYWQNQASMDALLEVRRAFHTLKGDARVAAQDSGAPDLEGLAALSEAAEDIIDELLGEDRDRESQAPALPSGAFGLLSDVQSFLLRRLAAREALTGEEELLDRLLAMQARARGEEPAPRAPRPARAPAISARPVAPKQPAVDHSRLAATFLSEADRLMPDLHRALALLSDQPGDENALVRARIKLHTLKGGAALAGPNAASIERLAHGCEDLLELVEDYQLSGSLAAVPAPVLSGILDAEDALHILLDGLRASLSGGMGPDGYISPITLPMPDLDALLGRLSEVKVAIQRGESIGEEAAGADESGEQAASPAAVDQVAEVAATGDRGQADSSAARPDIVQTQTGELAPLAGLFSLPATRSAARPVPPAAEEGRERADDPQKSRENRLTEALRAMEDQQVNRDALALLLQRMTVQAVESSRASMRLRDLVERVETELAGLRLELLKTTRRSGDWDALEKEEYTAIDVLLMQLDEALADQQEAETFLRRDVAEARAQNELQADVLLRAQRSLLDMSMVPLSSLEARLDHAVRSVSRRLHKTAAFRMDGADLALDNHIAETLFNPLMLLINNAVDHGLEEKAADRTAAGKPATGLITIRGRSNGDSITIEVGDDGRGIDPDRVVAVAISKGLVDAQLAAAMTRDERLALIWEPGFSTAAQVGAVSGRGMGMKSVQNDIAALQGRITVESEVGRGTTYTITLPRSLAMMRVQVVREGQYVAAVPISDITSTYALPFDAIVDVPGGRVVRIGSRTLAVHTAHLTRGPVGDSGDGTGTLLEVHGRQGGIVVDEVLYSQYLPVRPALSYLRRSCGLIGYGLGAGGVILPILDLTALIDKAAPAQATVLAAGTRARAATAGGSDHHTVLIVDDSQTMRRALSRTFERAGFDVREAANGREALTAFGQFVPDLITLDMEMPGMDGLETLSALRLLPGGASVSVFMITSRQQSRHRAAAITAGVTRYFTKPYSDDEVIGAARLAIAEGPLMAEAAS